MNDETKNKIKNIIDEHEVMLSMKGTPSMPQCGFSAAVVGVLNHMGINFETINVLQDPEIREGIKIFSDWPTILQLYVKKEFVGGCDIVREMHENGELSEFFEEKGINKLKKDNNFDIIHKLKFGENMTEVQYLKPKTIDEAVSLYKESDGEGKFLAGGTDLLVQISGMASPSKIIDIKNISDLQQITYTAKDPFNRCYLFQEQLRRKIRILERYWPWCFRGSRTDWVEQIQGRASLGGNLCNASPAGDSVPALIASGALVNIEGPNGARTLPVEKIHAGPGKTKFKRR